MLLHAFFRPFRTPLTAREHESEQNRSLRSKRSSSSSRGSDKDAKEVDDKGKEKKWYVVGASVLVKLAHAD